MRQRHGARATFNGTPALVMIAGPAAGWNVTDQQFTCMENRGE